MPENNDQDDHGDHDGTDDVDKVENFTLECGQASLGFVGQLGDTTKYGAVANRDNNARTSSRCTVSSLKADILGLKIVVVCRVN